MADSKYTEALNSLLAKVEEKEYLTFDEISECLEKYSLEIQDLDRLSSEIMLRNINVYESEYEKKSIVQKEQLAISVIESKVKVLNEQLSELLYAVDDSGTARTYYDDLDIIERARDVSKYFNCCKNLDYWENKLTEAKEKIKTDPEEKSNKEQETNLQEKAELFCEGKLRNADSKKIIEFIKKKVSDGSSTNQMLLGICYLKGLSVEQDYTKAFDLFEKASCNGNKKVKKWYGICFLYGYGTEINIEKGEKLLRLGDDDAYEFLIQYINDVKHLENFENNPKMKKDYSDITFNLATDYQKKNNTEKALEMYEISSYYGNGKAFDSLGDYYLQKKNKEKAIEMYKQAAKHGIYNAYTKILALLKK